MKKMPSSIALKVSLENLKKVSSFVHKWAKKASLSDHSEKELFLAVEEAYVNIVKYAYPEPSGKVTVYCYMDKDTLTLKIKDEGIPFNPLEFPQPYLASHLEEREVGGLGVFLIRRLVDNVEYKRQGKYNVLTLVKSKKK
ncbi:ATP-binding protein [Patescibacteria group bacterium]|nr:ATP-binding protein [Patescibacteria group bacterium]